MTPERWRRITEVFSAALEHAAASRGEWLEKACAGDEGLRAEVMSLIAAHEGPPNFIDTPAMESVLAAASLPAPLSWLGRTVGCYRIVEEIGRGGMSAVYKAVRVEEQFEHEVAIKLLRQSDDARLMLRRFQAERQILARLSHPNIAHLLDGGRSDDGYPYLVMEYVRGVPIDVHCERQQLDVTARLRLFRTLCDAVHYVHRHLMVHGDLKCNNVLVSEDGLVKLLDFGIARLLDSPLTPGNVDPKLSIFVALTPEYASPEQIRGQPITTASDVYSLGVLLYNLLTLQLPYQRPSDAYYDLAKHICEEPPRRASLAVDARPNAPCTREQLRGDLDNILLKALQKDPDQRYNSAEQLSEDVGRYLAGFPVLAAPASTGYRVRKFVSRNRALVAAVSLVVVSLLAGILATSWQAHLANQERQRAERHFDNGRKLAQTFMLDVHDSIKSLPGTAQARERIIANSLQYLDELLREKADDPDVRRDLALAYERVADLQGGFLAANLQDTESAIASLRKARKLREGLWADGVRDDALLRERFANDAKLAQLSQSNRSMEEAQRYATNAVNIAASLVRRPAATADDHRRHATAMVVQGTLQAMTGSLEAGLAQIREGTVIYEKLIGAGNTSVETRRSLAIAYDRAGGLLASVGHRFAEAYPMHLRALSIVDALLLENPLSTDLRKISAYELMGAGEAAAGMGDTAEALQRRAQAVERLRALSAAEPESEEFRFDLGWALGDLAVSLHERGDLTVAVQRLEEAQSLLMALSGARSMRLNTTQFLVAMNDMRLANVRITQAGDVGPARRSQQQALWLEARALLQRAAGVFAAAKQDKVLQAEAMEYSEAVQSALRTCDESLSTS
jgi:non-specific serine/threonine protein kinase/serine/threonine-protein kinase